MIEILPMEQGERKNEILSLVNDNEAEVLMLADGNEEIGYVAVKVIGSTLYYLNFEINNSEMMMPFEKEFYLDALMRAGASYGENRKADSLETVNNKYNDFLKKKGFKTDFSHAFAPMSLIVHYE